MDYRLFIDLDGVLCDFDRAVEELFGKPPHALSPREMWARLSRTPDFYTGLPWTPDGQALWGFVAPHKPTILTGLPRGNWAAPQKHEWCRRELGADVPVITCMSRDKAWRAKQITPPGTEMILVDDRPSNGGRWQEAGGWFILHETAERSIQALRSLGIGDSTH